MNTFHLGLLILIIIITIVIAYRYYAGREGCDTCKPQSYEGMTNGPNMIYDGGRMTFANKETTPNIHVTLYYADWCGHCMRMKPVWEQLKKDLADYPVTFVEKDNDQIKDDPSVIGVPTIFKIINERKYKYTGGPDYDNLRNWILSDGQ